MNYKTEEEMKELLENLIKSFAERKVANFLEEKNISNNDMMEDLAIDLMDILMDSEILEDIDSIINSASNIADEFLSKKENK